MKKTVLVLGGGVGGVVAANRLRKRLGSRHRIVLVDREDSFAFAASFLWVMTGDRRQEQVTRPLARLARKGIEVVHGEIERIDPTRRTAVVGGHEIQADHVIVALGAEFAPEAIPGLAEAGETFCTLAGAKQLRGRLADMRKGRIVVLTAGPAYKCPAAPYESAMLIDGLLRKRGLRQDVEIALHSAEPGPMGVAGPEVSAAVRGMVEQKGISYRPDHQVARAEAQRLYFTDGSTLEFDLLIYVPPLRPPRALSHSGLVDESGWVRVDRHTLETPFPGVYAVGDVTLIPLAMGKPLPRAGVFAHAEAEVVADNIAQRLSGQEPTAKFDGRGSCFIETGRGKAGYGAGDFYAEPRPQVKVRPPGRLWHLGKALFEKQFLWRSV